MEQENEKARRAVKRDYNDAVRALFFLVLSGEFERTWFFYLPCCLPDVLHLHGRSACSLQGGGRAPAPDASAGRQHQMPRKPKPLAL